MTLPSDEFPAPDLASRLRDRLLIAPQDSRAMLDLAALLEAAGDLPGAIDLNQRALRADPYLADAAAGLGRLWASLGEVEKARNWFARALGADPDHSEAAAGLALLAEASLTPAFIRTLFDQYAPRFDADLTGTLNYRAPELVAAALRRAGASEGASDILDLGCGTGLSGAALKPFARILDGVDLSPGMIAKARERGIYDSLVVSEADDLLGRSRRSWDMIVSVDMLNYINDLRGIFTNSCKRLSANGLIAGTIEKRDEGGSALTEKRRYAHGRDHLEAAAAAAGLVVSDLTEATLRTEGGAPVAGIVFVLRPTNSPE